MLNIENDIITFPNKKKIKCIYPIKSYVEFNSILIILLETPLNVSHNRNVFAYTNDGTELWQIENLFKTEDCPYNMLKIDENNLVHLYNWCGFVVKLNPNTGKVIERIFTR